MGHKDNLSKDEPRIATGIDDDEEISEEATSEEIENGESTKVISLRYDENPKS